MESLAVSKERNLFVEKKNTNVYKMGGGWEEYVDPDVRSYQTLLEKKNTDENLKK